MHGDRQGQWTESDTRAFATLREQAVALLAEHLRASLTPVWKAFGADPEEAARADAEHHIDALQTALISGKAQSWLDYLLWLQQVLVSRGADASLLAQGLDQLQSLYAQQLPQPTLNPVNALLSDSMQVLHEEREAATEYGGTGPDAWAECIAFQQALLDGNHARSAALFEGALTPGRSQIAAAVHVIQPALYDIGRQWQRNTVSVTQERLATTIVEAVLAQTAGLGPAAAKNGRRIVLARAPGNHHALGLRIVADAFEMAGWETRLLYKPACAEALIPLLRELQPELLGISASLAPHLLTTRELLRQLREALGESMRPAILGGLAVNQYPEIARTTGGEVIATDADQLGPALADRGLAA
ncbi:cobalamin B12-binding domain-containing protein [Algiphilus aromaticivorans]|uniref:cobalamin B12-binding domain-containing protein n=1 Tax=Algiphilus aromaticivorans TaxID=382454 RepID=UPI0006948E4F|nr:cobalamin B12-binding domain-containing protein [Algiphilus aromaticivorans]